MLGVFNLTQWEWFRLRRRVGFWILAGLFLLIPAMALAISVLLNSQFSFIGLGPETRYFSISTGSVRIIAPFLAIILAALIHAVDFPGGHYRTLVVRGESRVKVMVAKTLAATLALLAYHLIVYLLTVLTALPFSPHFKGWDAGLLDFAAAFEGSLLYLALGVALAHWSRSSALTVGVGIAFIAFEFIAYPIAGFIGQLADWPLEQIADWTIQGVAQGLHGDSETIHRSWYILIVAVYTIVLFSLATVRFQRSDLHSGGE